jgi:MFS family permease
MRNPRICLSFACAFTGRSDLVIKGMFLSLWAIHDASKWGMSPGQAMARFGLILVAMQFVAVIWQPSFGWIMDKVNRVTAMIIAMFFASTGYLSMVFVTSPLDYTMFPFFIILTLGSGSAIMASIGLVGQEAERKERAAVIGVNGMFGALGILVFSYFGGIWFDEWRPAGPFIVVGALQGVLLVVAAIVRIVAPGKQETG